MSEKKFEWCSMEDATHVEVNGQSYFLGSEKILLAYDEDDRIGISIVDACAFIPVDAFPILGIKPLKEKKREPIEFVGFTKYVSRTLSHIINVPLGTPPQTRFKCVEILEDEE